ncbi:MAG: PAS domain S-box protein [Actinobacteria bacterium]|nr:MAG: PAS domain S-box protein [Actinomycetota bacterium]
MPAGDRRWGYRERRGNVTGHTLAQARLLEALIEASPDPMWVYGPDLRFLFVSPAAERLSPRAPGEMIGRSWQELDMPAGLMEPFERQVRRVFATGERQVDEVGGMSGRMWEYILTPVHDEAGEVAAVLATARDITERLQHAEEHLRLLTAEQEARERLTVLAAAGEKLGSSLDYRTTVQQAAEVTVPALADWCAVDVVGEEGEILPVAVAHVDPDKLALARELQERYPVDPRSDRGVPALIRERAPQIVPEISDEMLRAGAHDPEHLELLRALDLRSYLGVPLVAHNRVVGALGLVMAESGRRYTEADIGLAEDLGRRIAFAVDNARLYELNRAVARTLQRSLLPPALPDIEGIELGASYRPAGSGTIVGGDFYDVFELPGGGAVAAIGDVCGKGVEAAALTGLVRHALRAAALRDPDPVHVLDTINEAIRAEHRSSTFCTVAYAVLEPGESELEVRLGCAGHPLPLLSRRDGQLAPLGEPGVLLGVVDDPTWVTRAESLGPGDALVLYTDGITEARSPAGQMFGEQRLHDVIARHPGMGAVDLAQTIQRTVAEFNPREPRDDKAILVVRRA